MTYPSTPPPPSSETFNQAPVPPAVSQADLRADLFGHEDGANLTYTEEQIENFLLTYDSRFRLDDPPIMPVPTIEIWDRWQEMRGRITTNEHDDTYFITDPGARYAVPATTNAHGIDGFMELSDPSGWNLSEERIEALEIIASFNFMTADTSKLSLEQDIDIEHARTRAQRMAAADSSLTLNGAAALVSAGARDCLVLNDHIHGGGSNQNRANPNNGLSKLKAWYRQHKAEFTDDASDRPKRVIIAERLGLIAALEAVQPAWNNVTEKVSEILPRRSGSSHDTEPGAGQEGDDDNEEGRRDPLTPAEVAQWVKGNSQFLITGLPQPLREAAGRKTVEALDRWQQIDSDKRHLVIVACLGVAALATIMGVAGLLEHGSTAADAAQAGSGGAVPTFHPTPSSAPMFHDSLPSAPAAPHDALPTTIPPTSEAAAPPTIAPTPAPLPTQAPIFEQGPPDLGYDQVPAPSGAGGTVPQAGEVIIKGNGDSVWKELKDTYHLTDVQVRGVIQDTQQAHPGVNLSVVHDGQHVPVDLSSVNGAPGGTEFVPPAPAPPADVAGGHQLDAIGPYNPEAHTGTVSDALVNNAHAVEPGITGDEMREMLPRLLDFDARSQVAAGHWPSVDGYLHDQVRLPQSHHVYGPSPALIHQWHVEIEERLKELAKAKKN